MRQIVKEFKGPLTFHLVKMGLSDEQANDLVQETFIKVNDKLNTFDPKRGKFTTWIYKIATNVAIDHLRKVKSKSILNEVNLVSLSDMEYDDRANLLPTTESPDRIISIIERNNQIKQLIDTLPEKYRELIILRYFYGYSYDSKSRHH